MGRLLVSLGGFACAALLVVSTAASQPPGGEKGKKGDKKGPPRYELGKVLPPFARDRLDLTAEQKKQVDELEAMVKERLEKILTAEQKKTLDALRPPMGKDGPPGKGGKGDKGPPDKGRPGGPVP